MQFVRFVLYLEAFLLHVDLLSPRLPVVLSHAFALLPLLLIPWPAFLLLMLPALLLPTLLLSLGFEVRLQEEPVPVCYLFPDELQHSLRLLEV